MSEIAERACKLVKESTTERLKREVRVGFLSMDEITHREQIRRDRLESMAERDVSGLTHLIVPLAHHVAMFGRFAREAGGISGAAAGDATDALQRLERIVSDLRQNIAETAPQAAPVRLQAAE